MSIKVMTYVWDIEFPHVAPKMVALKLADCASDRGDSIFPSVDTIERTTQCARSTVCKWLFALEHSGVLKVLRRSAGGAHKDTTVRAFDMDLLRRLGPTTDAGGYELPSELRLIEVRAKRLPQADKEAEAVVVDADDPRDGVTVTVFKVVPRTPPLAGGVNNGDSPPAGQSVQGDGRGEGSDSGASGTAHGQIDQGTTPPATGGVTRPLNERVNQATRPYSTREGDGCRLLNTPLPSVERTSPVRTADPTLQEPSRTVPLPPAPRKRGARERADLVLEVRNAKPDCARAFDKLLAPLFARTKFDAPNEVYALGGLAEFAEKQTDEVLGEAFKLLTEPGTYCRRYSAKAADVEDAIRMACTVVETRQAVCRLGPLIFRSSPEFAQAIAKVAEQHSAYADTLRCNEYLRRSDLKTYGVPQVNP